MTVAFVLMALLDRLFIGPTTSKLKSLDDEIAQQENVIKGDLRLLSYKNKILKENKSLAAFFMQKPQAEEEIIADFLKKIEVLATESKVNLAKVSPADSKPKKGFIEYYADLECDGTLENVAKFMYAINASSDLLKVVKFNLNPKKAGADEVVSNMTVTKVIIDASSIEEAERLINEFASGSGTDGDGAVGASGKAGTGSGGASGSRELGSAEKGASSQELSQRLQMKGLKPDEKNTQPDEEIEEVKPSVWEKIMQKEGNQEQENAE